GSVPLPPKVQPSYGGVTALASTNSDRVLDARYEDFAVADAASMGRASNRIDRLLDHLVLEDELDLHLGEEVDDILGTAIEFGMALLPAEALGLQHGDPLETDLVQGVLHFIELEGLDDRLDLLHCWQVPERRRRCCRTGQPAVARALHFSCQQFPQGSG